MKPYFNKYYYIGIRTNHPFIYITYYYKKNVWDKFIQDSSTAFDQTEPSYFKSIIFCALWHIYFTTNNPATQNHPINPHTKHTSHTRPYGPKKPLFTTRTTKRYGILRAREIMSLTYVRFFPFFSTTSSILQDAAGKCHVRNGVGHVLFFLPTKDPRQNSTCRKYRAQKVDARFLMNFFFRWKWRVWIVFVWWFSMLYV